VRPQSENQLPLAGPKRLRYDDRDRPSVTPESSAQQFVRAIEQRNVMRAVVCRLDKNNLRDPAGAGSIILPCSFPFNESYGDLPSRSSDGQSAVRGAVIAWFHNSIPFGSIKMRISAVSVVLLLFLASAANAQEATNLTRSEVAALKAKLVAVQEAMGGVPDGYIRRDEDSFYLPTAVEPAQDGKYWPIVSSVQMRFTDRGAVEGQAGLQKAQEDIQARYAAAIASGDAEAYEKLLEEMTQIQSAAIAGAMAPAVKKDDMTINVQFNMNPIVSIDPDAVVLEQSGVIALRDKDDASGVKGSVTVYLDPVALKATEELASFELRTAQDGVANKTGLFHIVIRVDGALADIEPWVTGFDYPAMLRLFDPR